MTPPSPDPTLSGALLVAAVAIFGPDLAPYISTYSLILIGWCAGLFVGLYTASPKTMRMPTPVFAFVTLVAVVAVTVPATSLITRNFGSHLAGISSADLFVPVAALIPAVGHRWQEIFRRAFDFLKGFIPKGFTSKEK